MPPFPRLWSQTISLSAPKRARGMEIHQKQIAWELPAQSPQASSHLCEIHWSEEITARRSWGKENKYSPVWVQWGGKPRGAHHKSTWLLCAQWVIYWDALLACSWIPRAWISPGTRWLPAPSPTFVLMLIDVVWVLTIWGQCNLLEEVIESMWSPIPASWPQAIRGPSPSPLALACTFCPLFP